MTTRTEFMRERAEAESTPMDAEPRGCPTCLRGRADDAPQAEDHVPALMAALRDVVFHARNTPAEFSLPRDLYLAVCRAEDVLQDVDPLPF